MPTRRFSGYTLRVRSTSSVYTKPASGHCVTGLYHRNVLCSHKTVTGCTSLYHRNALSANLLTYEIAESLHISMHAMVYGVLTQPYTHMWCMSSHTPWHAY